MIDVISNFLKTVHPPQCNNDDEKSVHETDAEERLSVFAIF